MSHFLSMLRALDESCYRCGLSINIEHLRWEFFYYLTHGSHSNDIGCMVNNCLSFFHFFLIPYFPNCQLSGLRIKSNNDRCGDTYKSFTLVSKTTACINKMLCSFVYIWIFSAVIFYYFLSICSLLHILFGKMRLVLVFDTIQLSILNGKQYLIIKDVLYRYCLTIQN